MTQNNPLIKIFAPIIAFLILSLSLSVFVVRENETVFLIEFGKIVRNIDKAGLQFRVPFVHEIVALDKRIMQVDTPAREVISLDQKRLIVDAYAKYKITDAYVFFQTLRSQDTAENRIKTIVDSSMRRVIASAPLSALLTEQRSDIMKEVKKNVSDQAESFGIKILDVRLIRADLPVENSEAIFSRMRTDREIEARQLRAQGQEESEKIKARADRDVREIIARANMDSDIIKGKADSKASQTYASSFGKDPDFFKFYRTMEAYKKTTNKNNTKAVITPTGGFWSDLKNNK